MGYTRYWKRTDEPLNADFRDGVENIIKEAAGYGIAIRGWDGHGEPLLSSERVSFNGNANAEQDLSHESFVLDSELGFCFCKTARKPYDFVVRKVLRLAQDYGIVEDVSDDGYNEDIYSDEQYIKGWQKWW